MALRHLFGAFESGGSAQNDTRTLVALAVVLLLLTAPLELSQLVFARQRLGRRGAAAAGSDLAHQ